jgi:hypothetical protein
VTGTLDQPLTDVSAATAPTVGSLDQPLADVTAATAPVTGTLDQPLADVTAATAPVTGTLDQPLADVSAATAPTVGSLDQSLADVTGTTTPVVGALDQPLADVTAATAPVTGAFDQPLTDISAATAPTVGSLDQPVADVAGASGPVVGSVDQPLGDAAAATVPVAGSLDQPLGDVTAATASADATGTASTGFATDLGGMTGATAAGDSPGAVAFPHPEVDAVGTHDAAALAVPEAPLPPGDVAGDGTAFSTPPPETFASTDSGGISLTQVLGTGYVTWKLALFTFVLASLTRWYGNATGCFGSARLMAFTNVQLIRCGFVSPVVRMASASVAAVGQTIGIGAAGTGAGTPTLRPRLGRVHAVRAVAVRSFRRLLATPKAAVRHTFGGDGDGALMMRIGKLLALAYVGFLAVWVWATRVRWNGKS